MTVGNWVTGGGFSGRRPRHRDAGPLTSLDSPGNELFNNPRREESRVPSALGRPAAGFSSAAPLPPSQAGSGLGRTPPASAAGVCLSVPSGAGRGGGGGASPRSADPRPCVPGPGGKRRPQVSVGDPRPALSGLLSPLLPTHSSRFFTNAHHGTWNPRGVSGTCGPGTPTPYPTSYSMESLCQRPDQPRAVAAGTDQKVPTQP